MVSGDSINVCGHANLFKIANEPHMFVQWQTLNRTTDESPYFEFLRMKSRRSILKLDQSQTETNTESRSPNHMPVAAHFQFYEDLNTDRLLS